MIALDDLLRARGNALVARDPGFFERLFAPLREGSDRPIIVTDVPLSHVRGRDPGSDPISSRTL